MSQVPDMEKYRLRRGMDIGVLTQMLFVSCNTTPAAIEKHVESSYVLPAVASVFSGLHAVVRWGNVGASVPGIQMHPSTEREGALRMQVLLPEQGELLVQVKDGLERIGCGDVKFREADDEPGGQLTFTLPAIVVRRLHGSVQAGQFTTKD